MQKAFGSHALGQTVDQPVADEAGSLWGDVSHGEPGATGGDDQICAGCMTPQGRDDQVELVGKRIDGCDAQSCGIQELADSRAGLVRLLATEATIANRKNDGASLVEGACGHFASVRV